jgi:hypothetical protein
MHEALNLITSTKGAGREGRRGEERDRKRKRER